MSRITLTIVMASLTLTTTAHAQAEIELWHAMGVALFERVNQIAENFNAPQDEV